MTEGEWMRAQQRGHNLRTYQRQPRERVPRPTFTDTQLAIAIRSLELAEAGKRESK